MLEKVLRTLDREGLATPNRIGSKAPVALSSILAPGWAGVHADLSPAQLRPAETFRYQGELPSGIKESYRFQFELSVQVELGNAITEIRAASIARYG